MTKRRKGGRNGIRRKETTTKIKARRRRVNRRYQNKINKQEGTE